MYLIINANKERLIEKIMVAHNLQSNITRRHDAQPKCFYSFLKDNDISKKKETGGNIKNIKEGHFIKIYEQSKVLDRFLIMENLVSCYVITCKCWSKSQEIKMKIQYINLIGTVKSIDIV